MGKRRNLWIVCGMTFNSFSFEYLSRKVLGSSCFESNKTVSRRLELVRQTISVSGDRTIGFFFYLFGDSKILDLEIYTDEVCDKMRFNKTVQFFEGIGSDEIINRMTRFFNCSPDPDSPPAFQQQSFLLYAESSMLGEV